MRRLGLATLAGLTVFGLSTGLAASLPVSDSSLGSGQSVTAACQTSGPITVSFGVTAGSASQVSEVTLSGVDAACDGQSVFIDVLGTDVVTVLGSGSGSAATGSTLVTLDAPVDAASVGGANVTITG